MKKILLTLIMISAAAVAAKAETVMIDFSAGSAAIYAEDFADAQEVVKTTAPVAGASVHASAASAVASVSGAKPESAAVKFPAAVTAGPAVAAERLPAAKPAAGAVAGQGAPVNGAVKPAAEKA